MTDDLVDLPAVQLRERLVAREVSARDVVVAHLDRMAAVDGAVNAVVTRTPEAALRRAGELDDALVRSGSPVGPLHGLPVVHKDLVLTAGVRTTFGSPAFADHVPDVDDLIVARMRNAGSVMLGKSNTPEFGAGSNTFNPVFGPTRNPWDTALTCGGSSGGAAVAVACGMAALADGSDLGGSLRNPPSFCGVVGLRPSVGRVPETGPLATRARLSVLGPVARTVADCALLLGAIAGPHALAPTALGEPGGGFLPPLPPIDRPLRVAVSADLGDLPLHPHVRAAFEALLPALDALGWEVEHARPELTGADHAFETIRSWYTASRHLALRPEQQTVVKRTVQDEAARGATLSAAELAEAFRIETRLVQAASSFFGRHDLFLCPAAQVPAFPVEREWVTEIDGHPMGSYIEWMRICSRLSVLGVPSLSLPIGFTPGGLPVGVQLVAAHGADRLVLRAGAQLEAALGLARRPPVEALAAAAARGR